MILTAFLLTLAAQHPCRAYDSGLPRPLSGWTSAGPGLATEHAVILPTRRGMVTSDVRIRRAGVFGIAIDQQGWIDVYPERGDALAMLSESRGPRCSTIRKIVRYRLRPGTYRVAVNRLKGSRAKLMLTHD